MRNNLLQISDRSFLLLPFFGSKIQQSLKYLMPGCSWLVKNTNQGGNQCYYGELAEKGGLS